MQKDNRQRQCQDREPREDEDRSSPGAEYNRGTRGARNLRLVQAAQVNGDLLGRLITVLRIFFQAFQDDSLELLRKAAVQGTRGWRKLAKNVVHEMRGPQLL